MPIPGIDWKKSTSALEMADLISATVLLPVIVMARFQVRLRETVNNCLNKSSSPLEENPNKVIDLQIFADIEYKLANQSFLPELNFLANTEAEG